MENFWMYQVEKLEEEQAKQKEQAQPQRDGEEVWVVRGWGAGVLLSIRSSGESSLLDL